MWVILIIIFAIWFFGKALPDELDSRARIREEDKEYQRKYGGLTEAQRDAMMEAEAAAEFKRSQRE